MPIGRKPKMPPPVPKAEPDTKQTEKVDEKKPTDQSPEPGTQDATQQ